MERKLRLEVINRADIQGEKTRIRPMRPDELLLTYEWEGDPDVQPFYGSRSRYRDFEEYAANVDQHYLDGSNPEEGRCFIIEANGQPIGMVNYNRIDSHNRSTEVDIVIGAPGHRNRGYGTDAMLAFLRFLFDSVGLHRVSLEVFEHNVRARRVYERLGFVQEGVTRESDTLEGRWVNGVIYGILEHEFEGPPLKEPADL